MGNLNKFIAKESQVKCIDDLSTDALVLFELLVLLVNIRYRIKYDQPIEWTDGRGYSSARERFEDDP